MCREHGYAGTWMSRDEFHAQLAHCRATGLKPDATANEHSIRTRMSTLRR
jgi:hypothetical protein